MRGGGMTDREKQRPRKRQLPESKANDNNFYTLIIRVDWRKVNELYR